MKLCQALGMVCAVVAFVVWGAASALADGVAAPEGVPVVEVSESVPVLDLSQQLTAITPPKPNGAGNQVTFSDRPFLAPDNKFESWSTLVLNNPGKERLERYLVFSYPNLARSGLFGAPAAEPKLSLVRYVEGRMPTELSREGATTRFAVFRLVLEPGETHSLVFRFEDTPYAAGVRLWEPSALRRFENTQQSLIGLYWGLLLATMTILFSMRVLSGAPATLSGGFVALCALMFETFAHGASSAGFAGGIVTMGWLDPLIVRSAAVVFMGIIGLQFLRHLLNLKEESPMAGVGVRLVQFALLAVLPFAFFDSFAGLAMRIAAAASLVCAGTTVWMTRYHHPQGLQLVPPGLVLLGLAALGAGLVSLLEISVGVLLLEPMLHGLFVTGTVLLVFAAAIRATDNAASVEHFGAHHAYVPAFMRKSHVPSNESEGRSLVPVEKTEAVAPMPVDGMSANQGLWDWTVSEDKLYVSPALEHLIGLRDGMLGNTEADWEAHVLEADKDLYTNTLRHYLSVGNSSFALDFRLQHADGSHRWINMRATGIAGDDGRMARCIGIITDITEAKVAEEQLVREASHDALTGVGNRALLMSHVDWAIAEFGEHPVHHPETGNVVPPSLIVIDLDRFKTVNDGLGHDGGDMILIEIADRITKAVGHRDSVARIGSDEFAVLMLPPEEGDMGATFEEPEDLANLLRAVISEPLVVNEQTIYPSASVGIARINNRHKRGQDVLSDAESALRQAKKNGGGEVEAYGQPVEDEEAPKPPAKPGHALSLETDMRHAIERGQLHVMFQPIVRLDNGAVAGFEALLRWQHPKHGAISPAEFVPIAEETGMIVAIGRFALSMAAMQLAQWQSHFPLSEALFVTVNVSSRQLLKDDFVRDVGNVLDTVELVPGTLKLEMTESMVFDDEERVFNLLRRLRQKGVSLAVDDYGTGYSSLSRVKSGPFSTLKIDQDFVHQLIDGGQSAAIVKSTIAMAHDLKLDVVAEGVETDDQARALHGLGCDFAQGFLFGEALSPTDAQRFIANHFNPEHIIADKADGAEKPDKAASA